MELQSDALCVHDEGLSAQKDLQRAGVTDITERAYAGDIARQDSMYYSEFGVQSIAHW